MDKFSVANIAGVPEEEVIGTIGDYKQSKKSVKGTVENILKMNKERRENKIKLYRMTLRDCVGRIEQQNCLRKTDIFYKIDKIIFGHPEYEQMECIEYVAIELRKYGFNVKIDDNATLYVSWKYLDMTNKS